PRPDMDARQAEWERSAGASGSVDWRVLDTKDMRSEGGARLTRRDDGAIAAEGPNPTNDSYIVVCSTGLKDVTALRLETLPDDRLPAKGPGRSENGNVVLTEVSIDAGGPRKIKAATADFSQSGYPAASAIDGNPTTGWAIHPEVGKAHSSVF